ncbi:hypothetical protein BJV77DRAFT_328883 [Russula vinacea]|nr:hypothetical protein BJV77DRAFT_328883 [Russula vinacea]
MSFLVGMLGVFESAEQSDRVLVTSDEKTSIPYQTIAQVLSRTLENSCVCDSTVMPVILVRVWSVRQSVGLRFSALLGGPVINPSFLQFIARACRTCSNMRQCVYLRPILSPLPSKARTPTTTISSTNKHLTLTLMSHTHPAASSSSSNFQLIINNALNKYKKRTKNDLLSHPLAVQLQNCDSPSAIFAILQEQLQGPDESRSTDERWIKWLDPTVNVLYAFSSILGAGVGLLFSPGSVIFAGVGVLLSVCS